MSPSITPAEQFRQMLLADYPQEPVIYEEIASRGYAWFHWRHNRSKRSDVHDAIVVATAKAALKRLRDGVKAGSIQLQGSYENRPPEYIASGDQRDGDLDVFERTLEILRNRRVVRVYRDICIKADVDDAPKVIRRAKPGPAPGTIDRFEQADRALFPEIERLMIEQHLSVGEAARRLSSRIAGRGTEDSRLRRLANRYRNCNS